MNHTHPDHNHTHYSHAHHTHPHHAHGPLHQPMKNVSRRGFIGTASAFLVSAGQFLRSPLRAWARPVPAQSGPTPSLNQESLDLQAIFVEEIRPNYQDNVYAWQGNKLQLDGESYVEVSRALIAHDSLDIVRLTPMPEEVRQKLMKEHVAKAEAAFLDAVASLDWPKYLVLLGEGEISFSGPLQLHLYAYSNQFTIFSFQNSTSSPQTAHFVSEEMSFPDGGVNLEAQSTRYVLGSMTPEVTGEWSVKIKITTDKGSRELVIAATVAETAILEGILVADEQDSEPPIARVRITSADGRYCPPEVQPSGLIRMRTEGQTTRAERWCYANGRFKVRVPLGKVKVSIRRGLEYRNLEEEVEVNSAGTVEKKFVLSRWAHMEKDGWYPGDLHVHMLDPKTALFESRAECLNFVNVMVFKHLDLTRTTEYFTGGVDPTSDDRHFIYYNEEFRNEPMGHVGLINLKKLVDPISTGRLGLHWPYIMRYEDLAMPLPFHGDADSPDFPLLLEAMRHTHKQGGLVDWAHLRSSEWEFPLDAEEGQIDIVDIMTHTDLPQDLDLWYALLNCDFHIPACAGTDRQAAVDPIGHQRVYVQLDAPLNYANWMKALKAGSSFVTNGPMVQLHVNNIQPGGAIHLSEAGEVNISARASSQIPFEKLDIIVNGEVIGTGNATSNGSTAEITLKHAINKSAWITARCMGVQDKDLFYSHPVFAHTNPVYVIYRKQRIAKPESANFLLSFLQKLEDWAERQAYFLNGRQKAEALRSIRKGMRYFEKISRSAKPA